MRAIKSENGMTIVEATIVFPTMFLAIFLMLFAGNAYLQKCRVDSIVTSCAIEAAAYCADPVLKEINKNGTIPGLSSHEVYPYRYFDPDGVGTTEADVAKDIEEKIDGLSTGLFDNMKPSNKTVTVNYKNAFIYSSFSIDVQYKIVIPVRLLGAAENIALEIASHVDMPVADSVEFIRTIDMVHDYMQRYGIVDAIDDFKEKIKNAFTKAKDFFKK